MLHIRRHTYRFLASPSSRRAWIEMIPTLRRVVPVTVALLAEGVDRNNLTPVIRETEGRRPPRGGRG